ncbi:hypothetical protein DIPPA_18557 [Diplonema papillatum]|nr:hypothetical protein DIPPA_18557 [Diplonema papillatum]
MSSRSAGSSSLAIVIDLRYPRRNVEEFGYMKSNVCAVLKPILIRLAGQGTTRLSLRTVEAAVSGRPLAAMSLVDAFKALNSIQLSDGIPSPDPNATPELTAESVTTAVGDMPLEGGKLLLVSCFPYKPSTELQAAFAQASQKSVATHHVVLTAERESAPAATPGCSVRVASPIDAKVLQHLLVGFLRGFLVAPFRKFHVKVSDDVQVKLRGYEVVQPAVDEVLTCKCHGDLVAGTCLPRIAAFDGSMGEVACQKGRLLGRGEIVHALRVGRHPQLLTSGEADVMQDTQVIELVVTDRVSLSGVAHTAVKGPCILLEFDRQLQEDSPGMVDSSDDNAGLAAALSLELCKHDEALLAVSSVDFASYRRTLLGVTVMITGEETGASFCLNPIATRDEFVMMDTPGDPPLPPSAISHEKVRLALAGIERKDELRVDRSLDVTAAASRVIARQKAVAFKLHGPPHGGAPAPPAPPPFGPARAAIAKVPSGARRRQGEPLPFAAAAGAGPPAHAGGVAPVQLPSSRGRGRGGARRVHLVPPTVSVLAPPRRDLQEEATLAALMHENPFAYP